LLAAKTKRNEVLQGRGRAKSLLRSDVKTKPTLEAVLDDAKERFEAMRTFYLANYPALDALDNILGKKHPDTEAYRAALASQLQAFIEAGERGEEVIEAIENAIRARDATRAWYAWVGRRRLHPL
jgi:elongation factor P hydroxylase